MLIVHSTKKLLRFVKPATLGEDERATSALGAWYATVLFWRPRVVLLVNETTLLPVLMPLAPARTLPDRIPEEIASVLAIHSAPQAFLTTEREHMRTVAFTTTRNRSVLGVMTELGRLADAHHDHQPDIDLRELAVCLSRTPCSPLYKRHVSPDRELAAVLNSL